MKLLKSLPGRIAIAIAAGIAIGCVAPQWLAGGAATFNGLMGQMLGFMIPLIIVGFVAPAIAEVGRSAGRMLAVTAALAYAATFLSGMMSYGIGSLTFPMIVTPSLSADAAAGASTAAEPWFEVSVPALMPVTTALALAFMLGLGCAVTSSPTLRGVLDELRSIVAKVIDRAVITLLPPYIMCIFLVMTVEGRVATILGTFAGIIGIIFAIHVLILLLQYAVAGAIGRRNPLRMLRTMLPAYLTALGTQSSAATIPVTLERTMRLGVSPSTAGFTVPLCATIHMSGSTLKIVACAMALMMMHGQACPTGQFVHFTAMLGITIIAAPGIPGGAIMASLGLLASILGFDPGMQAMMIALYIAMDSFGTACNVTGDGAIAVIVDKIMSGKS